MDLPGEGIPRPWGGGGHGEGPVSLCGHIANKTRWDVLVPEFSSCKNARCLPQMYFIS